MRDVLRVGFLNLGATHVSSDCIGALAWAFMGYLLPPGPNLTNITKWSHKKRVCFSSLGKTDKFTQHICLGEPKTSLIYLPRNLCPLQNAWTQLCVFTEFRAQFTTVRSRARKKQEKRSFITVLKRISLFSCTILIFWCLSAPYLLSHLQLTPAQFLLPPTSQSRSVWMQQYCTCCLGRSSW